MLPTEAKEIQLRGIGASPGICIGKAYLVDREGVKVVPKYFVNPDRTANEINRFKKAVIEAKDDLRQIISGMPEDLQHQTNILETHLLLFDDKMLFGRTVDFIQKDKVNAEWALKTVVGQIKSMFQSMEDQYLKERVSDIIHVSDRIMHYLTGADTIKISEIDKRVILVARDLSPADTSQIQLERIKGFLTDVGGKTSHTGIIARTLDIPAVLGLVNATALIRNDDILIVDGNDGVVIINPDDKTLVEYEERQVRYQAYRSRITRESHLPARTADGNIIRVQGNIELPEEVVSVIDNGGDGVGLYRTEFQYMNRTDFPSEFDLFDKYRDVVEVMAPNPVTIRTLDINGDKALSYAANGNEVNPALGLRAIRYCLKNPEIFHTQLRAILRAAAFGNVRILFPMITGCAELAEARRSLKEAAESLAAEGVEHNPDIEIGVMIEVPSAVIIADQLAEMCDFFSIGTNDLIQYTLAIDRSNRNVAYLYDPLNPAIIRMVKHVANVAHRKKIGIAMCGEMAGEPIHVPILLGLGITEWSMNPHAIPVVKRMVRGLSTIDAQKFVKEIIDLTSAEEINRLARERFSVHINNGLVIKQE
ncbi:MAG: phosphoenolpyruvate--protein phosphotransferase [Desulfobacteraceae bacterium]|nr:phosphoenolpyruvate--protein phosphotransferase [Desulfobacteraceae bacterium]MBC2750110.1 phosphoenolpyruvate--protein phosphotransferase [Desulfobacteraceae bacterium]